MTRRTINIALIMLFSIISVSSVFARPVKLEYRFKTGQNDRYKTTIVSEQTTLTSSPVPAKKDSVNVIVSQVVKGATKANDANIELIIKGTGVDAKRIPPTTHKFTVNKYGEQAKSKTNAKQEATGTIIILPKKRVSAGDSWTNKVYLNAEMGSIVAKYTYKGIVTAPNGNRAHKVVQTYLGRVNNPSSVTKGSEWVTGTSIKTQMEGTETYYLDRRDCRVISATGNTTLTITVDIPKTAESDADTIRYRTNMKTTLVKLKS